jgi:hypothetical protein
MFSSRNLVEEAASDKRKRQRHFSEERARGRSSDRQVIDLQAGNPTALLPQAWIVQFSDLLAEETLASGDKKLQHDLSAISGIYWLLDFQIADRMVWKQEKPSAPSESCMLLWWYEHAEYAGWYISERHWQTSEVPDEEDLATEYKAMAWLGKGNVPKEIPHMPYWAAKPRHGLQCQRYIVYLEEKVAGLDQLLLSYREYADTEGKKKIDKGEKIDKKLFSSAGSSGGSSASSTVANKDTAVGVKRGGWMEKMAEAAVLFYSNQTEKLAQLFDHHYNQNDLLRDLIMKGLKRAW